MPTQSPMAGDSYLRVARDPGQHLLHAIFGNDSGDGRGRLETVVARATSTDPEQEEHFRWLVGSAARFHHMDPVRPDGGPGEVIDEWRRSA